MHIWRKLIKLANAGEDRQPHLHPSEILPALTAYLDREKKIFRDKTVIPDHVSIALSIVDMRALKPIIHAVADELADEVRQFAKRKRYRLNTTAVSVHFIAHREMTPGTVALTGGFRPAEPAVDRSDNPPASETAAEPPAIILNIEPKHHAAWTVTLAPGTYVIGRGSDADIRLPADDRLASKHHCRISSEGETLRLVDLNSVNGTLCNQEPVSGTQVLADKDRLLVGTTRIEVLFA